MRPVQKEKSTFTVQKMTTYPGELGLLGPLRLSTEFPTDVIGLGLIKKELGFSMPDEGLPQL